MSSFTAKPYASPGKASSLPRFKPGETADKEKAQTLPNVMPTLSGDVLKQRLASMGSRKPQVPQKKDHSFNPAAVAAPAPIISEHELRKRRESMNRPPAPSTPDAKQKYDKTPEFLRKKLKPTSLPPNDAEEKKDGGTVKSEDISSVEEEKKSFRNSRLLFENISAAPKVTPRPAPKPAPRPKNSIKRREEQTSQDVVIGSGEMNRDTSQISNEASNLDSVVAEKEKSELAQSDIPEQSNVTLGQPDENQETSDQSVMAEKSTEALDQLDNILKQEDKNEEVFEETIEKPHVELPDIPVGLDLWMNHFVKTNTGLLKLDSLDTVDAPTAEANDDIYDDVAQSGGVSGLVQDTPAEVSDELYDDVAATQINGSSEPVEDMTYDDVLGSTQQSISQGQTGDDIYDDVQVETDTNQELYDDACNVINGGYPTEGIEEADSGEPEGEALYEPVETISQYVTQGNIARVPEEKPAKSLRPDTPTDKGNKKKEEKERKEREKQEKKKREDAERRRKKDEEEKKKRDKEERERIKKERKLFGLRPDEDPIPIERHMAECDVKGKGKDLTITQGEYLDVISKRTCPKGKVLVQNASGKLGYVQLKDIGMDKRKSLFMATSPVAPGVAYGDVEEQHDSVRGISASTFSSEIVSLSSTSTNGSIAPSFGQSLGVFQFGQSAPTTASNEEEDGGDFYEQI